MSTVGDILSLVQQNTIRYGYPFLLVLGNIGNVLCIVVFLQKNYRQSFSSWYLLTAAVFSIVGVSWGIGTNMYAVYQPPDPFIMSDALCRIRGYLLQTSSVLTRTMIILACAGRVAASSNQVRIRQLNQPRVIVKIIAATTLFWMIISIQLPIFQRIEMNRCATFGVFGLWFSAYQIFLFGLVFPSLMIILSILILKNLKNIRGSVRPQEQADNTQRHQLLSRRDMNLLKLTFAEVISCFVLSFLYPINALYGVIASNVPNKSKERIQIEGFMTFFAQVFLLYLNYCITFYLYVIISKPFRQEIKRVIFRVLKRPERNDNTTIPLRSIQKQRTDLTQP
ncbi:unnamed protein product [Adineta ricciae]|uniref:G-protein coupled receptors family 1 profile domain-containing protein n=1 Tax=Adineta ricciae TaxID=249248 RepID=A0A814EF73_ADIRI|nr:unnamed protein product [Adineta ricciae]CAF1278926.1 unnamed protein product [Adineta ricciae]